MTWMAMNSEQHGFKDCHSKSSHCKDWKMRGVFRVMGLVGELLYLGLKEYFLTENLSIRLNIAKLFVFSSLIPESKNLNF